MEYGMRPEDLKVYEVDADRIGIVTTKDGKPLPPDKIAGSVIPEHNNFQNGQQFIDGGGYKGLQEEFLRTGAWNLNPWFVKVEQVPLTEIPRDHVGVVISNVGDIFQSNAASASPHGNLVESGYKGVWREPLYPRRYAINIKVMDVELVPTHRITLNWSNKDLFKYDKRLSALNVRDKDGFDFNIEVTQIIRIAPEDAPKVVCRIDSVDNLVDKVLQPTVENYFLNAAQNYAVSEFDSNRTEIQAEAADEIRAALKEYYVEAVDTLIRNIELPAPVRESKIARKLAQEQKNILDAEKEKESKYRELLLEQELTKTQQARLENARELENAQQKGERRHYLVCDGQAHLKAAPFTDLRGEGNLSPMTLGNRLGNGKSQSRSSCPARACLIRPPEAIEDVKLIFSGNTNTRILYRHQGRAILFR